MRRFYLDRIVDETGISGTGCVAQGVIFTDGTVALRWITKHRSTSLYSALDEVVAIHGHGGKTCLRFDDPICFACGAVLWVWEQNSRHCTACGAGQGDELFYEAKPNPSLGTWSPAIVIGAAPESKGEK